MRWWAGIVCKQQMQTRHVTCTLINHVINTNCSIDNGRDRYIVLTITNLPLIIHDPPLILTTNNLFLITTHQTTAIRDWMAARALRIQSIRPPRRRPSPPAKLIIFLPRSLNRCGAHACVLCVYLWSGLNLACFQDIKAGRTSRTSTTNTRRLAAEAEAVVAHRRPRISTTSTSIRQWTTITIIRSRCARVVVAKSSNVSSCTR